MTLYAVNLTTQRTIHTPGQLPGPWTTTIQSPTFILDSTIQGITSPEHAAKIARHWFTDMGSTVTACTVSVYTPTQHTTGSTQQ